MFAAIGTGGIVGNLTLSNFTATANAVLKLGTLDETVIVTGASPVVDVRQVQQTQVVPRDMLDALRSATFHA